MNIIPQKTTCIHFIYLVFSVRVRVNFYLIQFLEMFDFLHLIDINLNLSINLFYILFKSIKLSHKI